MLNAKLPDLLGRLHQAIEVAGMVVNLTRDLPGFVARPVSPDAARARVLAHLAARDARFLTMLDRQVFRHPGSPYLRLLRHAGCELGDVAALVARDGIDGTLRTLADAGVYVTFDEFKGRRAVVRGSLQFTVEQRGFDHPSVRAHGLRYTSGSGGRASRVLSTLGDIDERAMSTSLVFQAHGVQAPRHVMWSPVPLSFLLICARLGQPTDAWFYPVHPLPGLARLAARHAALVGRLGGYRFPSPSYADLASPERLVGWLTARLKAGRPLVLWTTPSAGTRIGIAATQGGQRLDGMTLMVVGEPLTEARRRHVEASGARVIAAYSSTEVAAIGFGCATPSGADDMHLMAHRIALIQRPRPVSEGGTTVPAALLTGLSPYAGKVALNVETGDYLDVAERDCGCSLGTLGLRTHLSGIRSFEKVTGEGVTVVRSHLERVLEEVLPSRFGGAALDYQLTEAEVPGGATRLVLRVSPSIGEVDEAAIRSAVLEEVGRGNLATHYQAGLWRRAGTLEVVREAPIVSRAGKVLPFQLLRPAGGVARRP